MLTVNVKEDTEDTLKDALRIINIELTNRKAPQVALEDETKEALQEVYTKALESEVCNITIQVPLELTFKWNADEEFFVTASEEVAIDICQNNPVYDGDDEFLKLLNDEDVAKYKAAEKKVKDRSGIFLAQVEEVSEKHDINEWELIDMCAETNGDVVVFTV